MAYFYVLSSSGNKFFQSDDMNVWSRIEAEEIRKREIFGAPKGTQNI